MSVCLCGRPPRPSRVCGGTQHTSTPPGPGTHIVPFCTRPPPQDPGKAPARPTGRDPSIEGSFGEALLSGPQHGRLRVGYPRLAAYFFPISSSSRSLLTPVHPAGPRLPRRPHSFPQRMPPCLLEEPCLLQLRGSPVVPGSCLGARGDADGIPCECWREECQSCLPKIIQTRNM